MFVFGDGRPCRGPGQVVVAPTHQIPLGAQVNGSSFTSSSKWGFNGGLLRWLESLDLMLKIALRPSYISPVHPAMPPCPFR
jgi:hypothetical protein